MELVVFLYMFIYWGQSMCLYCNILIYSFVVNNFGDNQFVVNEILYFMFVVKYLYISIYIL